MLGLVRGENLHRDWDSSPRTISGRHKPSDSTGLCVPLKTKVQLREQEARRELGKMIIQQMTAEEAQAARQAVQQMGPVEDAETGKVFESGASQPRMARRKIDHARLASLSAPGTKDDSQESLSFSR